jgi:hypothetical protein
MIHPLVQQLRFTRTEFLRALEGLSDSDAGKRFLPMNCISWNVGHLAWQEQRHFLYHAQGKMLLPQIHELFAYGAPASTPDLKEMLSAWQTITKAADPWLDELTTEQLQGYVLRDGKPTSTLWGSVIQRVIYHYWYHLGENSAIRQNLGHTNLPQFVGDLDGLAPYQPE